MGLDDRPGTPEDDDVKEKLEQMLAECEQMRKDCERSGDELGAARMEGKILALEVLAELYGYEGLY